MEKKSRNIDNVKKIFSNKITVLTCVRLSVCVGKFVRMYLCMVVYMYACIYVFICALVYVFVCFYARGLCACVTSPQ